MRFRVSFVKIYFHVFCGTDQGDNVQLAVAVQVVWLRNVINPGTGQVGGFQGLFGCLLERGKIGHQVHQIVHGHGLLQTPGHD
jgi:hypothetical protein